MSNAGTWFHCDESKEDAPFRLFVFPHAGGDGNLYKNWTQKLPQEVELVYLSLPGRARKHHEQPVRSTSFLIDSLCQQLFSKMDRPFIFIGHSFGALLAYRLCCELVNRGLPTPIHLIVSGSTSPEDHTPLDPESLNNLESFKKLLQSWGGTPEEVLNDDKLLSLALPSIQADLMFFNEKETIEFDFRLEIPITAYSGIDDEFVTPTQLENWKLFTNSSFEAKTFNGDHFYFLDHFVLPLFLSELSDVIKKELDQSKEFSQKAIAAWNGNTMDYPEDKCLHDLFVEAVKRSPDAVAVYYKEHSYTFKQVDEYTNLLAHYLQSKGVGVSSITGILMEHCAEFVFAYIAALKAGGAYMPIEIVYPPDLLSNVIKESQPKVVLTKEEFAGRLPEEQLRFCLDSKGSWIQDLIHLNLPSDIIPETPDTTPDDLAYVVMSSGTTGIPKGICCPHRGAVHSYSWRLETYPFEEDERVASHVFFVWELLRPLLGNKPLFVIPDEIIFDPPQLLKYLFENKITRILFTPSLLQLILDTVSPQLLKDSLQSMKIIWLCGEVVTRELSNRFQQILPNCLLLNLYSISECHDVSAIDLAKIDTHLSPKFAPCGKVIPNVSCYVYFEDMTSTPIGVPGELYVGGPCIAIGYLNRPEQTASRFINHPETGVRLYKTGDRGRFLPDGSLEVIGRCDFMVKVRGYSIVLGAVEAAISEHSLISTCVVITDGEEGEDKRLVAYVVPENWEVIPNSANIRKFLTSKLPHYAIPSIFIQLNALPIHSASGKTDRKKLPNVSESTHLQSDDLDDDGMNDPAEKPSSPLEMSLAGIWANLLRSDFSSINLNDNFFDIGGHSLLATRLNSAINEAFNINMTLAQIMSTSTLLNMANLIAELRNPSTAPPTPVNKKEEKINFRLEAVLDNSIYPASTRKMGHSRYRVEFASQTPRRVLVTGITGFLGGHILNELLVSTHTEVYCLIRAPDEAAAFKRIRKVLETYGFWNDDMEHIVEERVFPVCGDLSKPLLGLEGHYFKMLAGEIDAIIHNGAEVNLIKSYSSLKAVNVLGTEEVFRLAVTNGLRKTKVKPVHYISTNGVFPPTMKDWKENANLNDVWQDLDNGYSQSKWVAEQLCLEAQRRGLPVSILRPGNMAPSSKTGIWNSSDFVYLLLKGCASTGAYPNDVPWTFDLTPVDFAAQSIVYLSVTNPLHSLGRTLHIQNPQDQVPAKAFFEWVNQKTNLCSMSYQEWLTNLSSGLRDKENDEILQKLSIGIESFSFFLTDQGKFHSNELVSALSPSPIKCPAVDANLLLTYLNDF